MAYLSNKIRETCDFYLSDKRHSCALPI